MRKIAILAVVSGCLLATFMAAPAAASTVVVTPSNPDGWTFFNGDNNGTNSSGSFVVGPATPPLGSGSANFVVGDSNSSEILYQTFSSNISASSLTALSYSTYVTTSTQGSGSAPTLQFSLYAGNTFYGRMVFDPGLLGPITDNTWQSWDATTADAWYFTKTSAGNCAIGGNYCTLSQVQTMLASKGITLSGVLFKAGSGQNSFNGNVDAFTLNNTTYDFEANAVPEPGTIALLSGGLALLGFMSLRRRNAAPKA